MIERLDKRGRRISAWGQSETFRAVGRASVAKRNRLWPVLPKCGAHARSTGEPCKQIAMANGRCHFHGGKTPKGKDWHRMQLPKSTAPDAPEKLERKLRQHTRAEKKRADRVAAMTPEERAKYKHWQKSHAPTSVGKRDAARQERQANDDLRKFLAEALPADFRKPSPGQEGPDRIVIDIFS